MANRKKGGRSLPREKLLEKICGRDREWDRLFKKYTSSAMSDPNEQENSLPVHSPELWEDWERNRSLKEVKPVNCNQSICRENSHLFPNTCATRSTARDTSDGPCDFTGDQAKSSGKVFTSKMSINGEARQKEVQQSNVSVSSFSKFPPVCVDNDVQSMNSDTMKLQDKEINPHEHNSGGVCNFTQNDLNGHVNTSENCIASQKMQEKVDSHDTSEVMSEGVLLANTTSKSVDVYDIDDFLSTNYDCVEDENIKINFSFMKHTSSKTPHNVSGSFANVMKCLSHRVQIAQQKLENSSSNALKSITANTTSNTPMVDMDQSTNCDAVENEDTKTPNCENNKDVFNKRLKNLFKHTNDASPNISRPENIDSQLVQHNVDHFGLSGLIGEKESVSANTVSRSTCAHVENDISCTNQDPLNHGGNNTPNYVRKEDCNNETQSLRNVPTTSRDSDNCYGIQLWGHNAEAIEMLLKKHASREVTAESPFTHTDNNFQCSSIDVKKFAIQRAIKKWGGASKSIDTMIKEMCTCGKTTSKSLSPCANVCKPIKFNSVECQDEKMKYQNDDGGCHKPTKRQVNPVVTITRKCRIKQTVQEIDDCKCNEMTSKQESSSLNLIVKTASACADICQPTSCDTVQNEDSKRSSNRSNKDVFGNLSKGKCKDEISSALKHISSQQQVVQGTVKDCGSDETKSERANKTNNSTKSMVVCADDDFQTADCDTVVTKDKKALSKENNRRSDDFFQSANTDFALIKDKGTPSFMENIHSVPIELNSVGCRDEKMNYQNDNGGCYKSTKRQVNPVETITSGHLLQKTSHSNVNVPISKECRSTNAKRKFSKINLRNSLLSEHLKTTENMKKKKSTIRTVLTSCWIHSENRASPPGNIPTPENCVFCRAVERQEDFFRNIKRTSSKHVRTSNKSDTDSCGTVTKKIRFEDNNAKGQIL